MTENQTAITEVPDGAAVEGAVLSGPVKRGGAPAGNTNRMVHGLRLIDRHGFTLSKLPPKSGHIKRSLTVVRRTLEAAIVEARGSISVVDAALVVTALRHERHCQLCNRWLLQEYNSLTVEQRQSLSRDIARSSAERDKAIAALNLDRSAADSFDRAYQQALQASFAPPTETPATPDNASESNVANVEGNHANPET